MNRTCLNFQEMVTRVLELNNFTEILERQHQKFDLQPYKMEQSDPLSMLKLYKSIESKYKLSKQLSIDENSWNQNQRRLFVWYIISYSNFQQQNHGHIPTTLWSQLSPIFFFKRPDFLEFQYLNLLKFKKRVAWTESDDKLLVEAFSQEKPGKWNEISKKMFYLSNRAVFKSPKHCRQRWLNHLDSNKRHGNWSINEDYIIFKYVCENGKKWSKIAALLNSTRTEHMVKNRFNSLISKNKTHRKQKEEDIAKKIYRQLKKSSESQLNNQSKTPTLKNEAITRSDKISQQIEQGHLKLPQLETVQSKSQFTATSQAYPFAYGCYYDYSTLFLINPYLYSTAFTQKPQVFEDINENQLNILSSKHSSFTPYHNLI